MVAIDYHFNKIRSRGGGRGALTGFQEADGRTPPAPAHEVLEHRSVKMCLCPVAFCLECIVGSCGLQQGACNDTGCCVEKAKT